jgi:hypothetical protein
MLGRLAPYPPLGLRKTIDSSEIAKRMSPNFGARINLGWRMIKARSLCSLTHYSSDQVSWLPTEVSHEPRSPQDDSLTMMYEAVSGALAADGTMRADGKIPRSPRT